MALRDSIDDVILGLNALLSASGDYAPYISKSIALLERLKSAQPSVVEEISDLVSIDYSSFHKSLHELAALDSLLSAAKEVGTDKEPDYSKTYELKCRVSRGFNNSLIMFLQSCLYFIGDELGDDEALKASEDIKKLYYDLKSKEDEVNSLYL